MNIQEYISSGIIESYVLGLADEQEQAEFERMCAAHNEVREARNSFEILLEKQAQSTAIAPPKNIRSQVFTELQIKGERKDNSTGKNNSNTLDSSDVRNAPVVRMANWVRYVAAASVILLIGSTALNFYFFNRYKSFSAKYEEVVAQNSDFAKNKEVLEASNKEYQTAFEKLRDPAMAVIKMEGKSVPTSPDPSSMATVYWDSRTKDVYLFVNNMPSPSADKQYQLWAIVDGVPVDAGVFDVGNGVPVRTMKNIPKAQAFAVTLEKKGGSPQPAGDMYVLGKVS